MPKVSNDELKQIYLALTDEQKHVLDEHVRRGMKTKWLNAWAKKFGNALTEDDLLCPEKAIESLEWILLDYEDSLVVDGSLRCECNRPLRYRYTIANKSTGEIFKLGTVHFEQHTGLSPDIISLIIKGQKEIDLEKDEILTKVKNGWKIPFLIPMGFILPSDMEDQINVRLPLLERQEKRLQGLLNKYQEELDKKMELERLKNVDLRFLINQLNTYRFTELDAKLLYDYLKNSPAEINMHGLDMKTIKQAVINALGHTPDKRRRKWLVEIEYLNW